MWGLSETKRGSFLPLQLLGRVVTRFDFQENASEVQGSNEESHLKQKDLLGLFDCGEKENSIDNATFPPPVTGLKF